MWEHVLSRWGYFGIALGTFVEGEAVLLAAGAFTHLGRLSLPFVVLAATLGSLLWGQTWFFVGRRFGRGVIERRPTWRAHAHVLERWIARYGSWLVLGFRFIAGAAIVLPLLVGASGFPRGRFFVLDGLGALIWASVFAGLGLGIGAGLQGALGRAIGLPEIAGIALGGAFLLLLVTRLVRLTLARGAATPPSP